MAYAGGGGDHGFTHKVRSGILVRTDVSNLSSPFPLVRPYANPF